MTHFSFEQYSGEQTLAILANIADVYSAARSGNPDESDEMFSRSSFLARTGSQAREPGFELIAAMKDDVTAGFSFGYPFPAGKWWADCTSPAQEIIDSSKFAVIELDVLKSCQGQGLGKKLLGVLLSNRAEKFATLAATPGTRAHGMYMRWDWHKVGEFTTPPAMDALLIPLVGGAE